MPVEPTSGRKISGEGDSANMRITWYGHAAFLIEGVSDTGQAVRIVLDPYRAPDVGSYGAIDDEADIVALSHENAKYHSHVAGVRGRKGAAAPVVVDGLALLDAPRQQAQTVLGVPFTAARVWENDAREEPIAMVGLTLEGIRVLHMGDCGHALTSDEVAACGPVDVLLALAGGLPTLTLSDLSDFVAALSPRIVIPMHFGNNKINLNLLPVTEFLSRMPPEAVRHLPDPTVEIRASALPEPTEIWVLPPAR